MKKYILLQGSRQMRRDDDLVLMPHQQAVMDQTEGFQNVADYIDMGGGKTFIGSEQMKRFGLHRNLVICQKSKLQDWLDHFRKYYPFYGVYDLTDGRQINYFLKEITYPMVIGIINYDLVWRRPQLRSMSHFTMMLDESSMIANERSNRAKFVLRMMPEHVILLSGTPVSGKYEQLWSQLRLLGWRITKTTYYDHYINTRLVDMGGFRFRQVTGYKNVDRLKEKLREHGAVFMKAEEFGVDLPPTNDIAVNVRPPAAYKKFLKDRVATVSGLQLVGDTTLTQRLYLRQICSQYNRNKLQALEDLLASTDDRLIIFYNFNEELRRIRERIKDRPISVVNGEEKNLQNFEECSNAVLLVQYQAGAMGLNLQKANKVIYFSLPERSELFEQSKARIHRIGQTRPCFYYYLLCPDTIEMNILETLRKRKDYTDELFRKDYM